MNIFDNVDTIAVTCLQFGDTGKGKVVDLLAERADIIVRGTGGANAGHSINCKGQTLICHLIPSGILHDAAGKINIVGSGVAVDPKRFCDELDLLQAQGIECKHLMLALNAKLTLPTQIVRDRVKESSAGKTKIGTTGRGIGPTYGDHATRDGLFINDLLNPDILAAKVKENVAHSVRFLRSFDPEVVKKALHHPDLSNGIFYHSEKMFDVDAIVQKYVEYGKILACFIRDTDRFVQQNVGVRRILLEGANGALLDVDYGTYPYVTSTGCTVDSLAKGAGLNRSHVDLALGVFKGFYETRVGEGPMPTEFGGEVSAEWCREHKREDEEAKYAGVTVNDPDEFRQGVAIRRAGNEYGATTGRPRRTGWLDVPLLRYALIWGGPDVALTKLDVLNDCAEIKVCTSYKYVGPDYRFGDQTLQKGNWFRSAIPTAEVLKHCEPVYTSFPGWKTSLKGITKFGDLPNKAKDLVSFVVHKAHVQPRIISIGADRAETIFV